MMPSNDPPTFADSLLFALFDYLRRNQFPLGVDDYMRALTVLRSGRGLQSRAALQSTLQLLWVKSIEDAETFTVAFQRFVIAPLEQLNQSDVADSDTDDQKELDSTDEPIEQTTDKMTDVWGKQIEEQIPLPPNINHSMGEIQSAQRFQLQLKPPISRREITHIWRYLHKPQRFGPLVELDVDATIAAIARGGLLQAPVFQARRRNRAKLVVLLDTGEDMIPFRVLTNALINSIQHSGSLARRSFLYFQQVPHNILATTPNMMQGEPFDETLATHMRGASVLIIGEAGAARRIHRGSWVENTQRFLEQLRHYTYLYAWLNPLPRRRWASSSAEKIATLIPMYPINWEGLIDAVNILRGHPFPRDIAFHANR